MARARSCTASTRTPARSCHRHRRAPLPGHPHRLDGDAVELERLHRGRANAENRVRAAKQTGLDNLPFRESDLNTAGLELSPIAQDLSAGTQALCLDGEPATCEPKTLRYRLLHTAGRLASLWQP
jgi:hypothetical protein